MSWEPQLVEAFTATRTRTMNGGNAAQSGWPTPLAGRLLLEPRAHDGGGVGRLAGPRLAQTNPTTPAGTAVGFSVRNTPSIRTVPHCTAQPSLLAGRAVWPGRVRSSARATVFTDSRAPLSPKIDTHVFAGQRR
ncbi:hypothetical protein GCM10010182_11720 [Actinomadura cremea]|nr:hypothetical protein GCM10010182_11720 [Actinomadura cremea]